MKTISKTTSFERELWFLVGPTCLLLTLAVVLLKPHSVLHVPWLALIGFALCWLKQLRGFGIALGLLGGVLAYQVFLQTRSDILWELGVAVALGCGFLATALSAQEGAYSSEPQPLMQDPVLLQKLAQLEDTQVKSAEQVAFLKEEIAEQTAIIESYQKLLTMAHEEVLCSQHLLEKEQEELHHLRRQTKNEEERQSRSLIEAQQALSESHAVFTREMQERDQALDRLQGQLQRNQEHLDQQQRALEQVTKELAQTGQRHALELKQLEAEREQVLWKYTDSLAQLQQLQADFLEVQKQVDIERQKSLTFQKEAEEERQKNLSLTEEFFLEAKHAKEQGQLAKRNEGLYKQMRAQFEEKSQLLDQTRKELFQATEKWQILSLEQLQTAQDRNTIEKGFEKHLQKMERIYRAELNSLQNECNLLESLITDTLLKA